MPNGGLELTRADVHDYRSIRAAQLNPSALGFTSKKCEFEVQMDACLQGLAEIELRPWPHVIILGAGASRAASPDAEARGRVMPVMQELPDRLDLDDFLDPAGMASARQDFEAFFSKLHVEGEYDLQKQIEARTFDYFDTVELANSPTLYDRLILSLRRKDHIASFNWDPLLPYAYRRSGHLGSLPSLAFLHGNVRLGVCRDDRRFGWSDDSCLVCHRRMNPVHLLYPVQEKDYSSDPAIAQQWDLLEWQLESAYFVTIFGWSAPPTDVDARTRIVRRVQANRIKRILQVEILDLRADELVRGNLAPLIGDGIHWHANAGLDQSWLAVHPRLTCEALFEATMQQSPIQSCRLPETNSLEELHSWVHDFDRLFSKAANEGYEGQG